jgi:hypothetical protein
MDESRKRVLAIVAGILVARHLKNPEDLHESRPPPDRIINCQCGPMGGANHAKD